MSEILKPVVTAVAEPRPDGEKITRAVLAFPGKLPNVDDIEAVGRTVVGRETDGSTVTLLLSEEDEAAVVLPQPKDVPEGTPPWELPERKRRPIEVEVRIPGCAETVRSTRAREPVIEEFTQSRYKSLPYNLYTPKHMEPGKKYPLVMFIPVASVNGGDALAALSQGAGATVWAESGEQEKRPCYVLAIQVPKSVRLTMPGFQAGPGLEEVRELVDKIVAENRIDPDRVYATAFPENDDRALIPIAHHSRGWELTYQLEAAREWLFAQTRR